MGKVILPTTAPMAEIVASAGGDQDLACYHHDTQELEVPGVSQAALQAAADGILDGTAAPTTVDIAVKIAELSAACEQDIESGFQSSALGGSKWYDSKREDQLNLVGACAANEDDVFPCRTVQGAPRAEYFHTAAELSQVLRDGKIVKQNRLRTFSAKRALVETASTLAELNAVIW